MDILILLLHPLDNLHIRFSLAISLWLVWGRRYILKSTFRSRLLVLSADKLGTTVHNKTLWYPNSRKVCFGQRHYCCSECVGQNIDFDPITAMTRGDQIPFFFPHEDILTHHRPWAVWNIMAEHGFFWGLTSILSIQWAWRALFLDIGRHAWL